MKNNAFIKLFRRWIMSVDRLSLLTILCIIFIGVWVNIASTPAVAMKLNLPPFYFVKRHITMIPIAIFIIILLSCMHVRHIRRLSVFGYFICLGLIILTLLFGAEIKGAKRWLSFCGFSFQASEFFKPILTVITAWLVSEQYRDREFPGIFLSAICVLIVVSLLLLQPDVGMVIIIALSLIGQLFISGLSTMMIIIFLLSSIVAIFGLYCVFPHFADRINGFILKGGEEIDMYQVQKSIAAFKSGGLLGKGPGEGVIKTLVPDAHSDFVFSVIAEEFGFIMCIAIISLFIFLIFRSLIKISESSNMFCFSTVFGILFQVGMQVLINVSTSLNLIPTKGMTMPFISYGGSSLLASSISVGILLAIKRSSAIRN
ncbi:MAG: FtsW/RodA/SpoVE family cell cycle protein [Holosporales bacterium]|jgi:cell division protein FtsW|nr:FtsW/RodA/SpoVE family cell cycle protein [Holosporales bacterium]